MHEYLKEQNEKLLIKNNSEGYQSQMNYEENQEEVFYTNTFVHGSFDQEELEECNENGYMKEKNPEQNTHNQKTDQLFTIENNRRRLHNDSQNIVGVSQNEHPMVTVEMNRTE